MNYIKLISNIKKMIEEANKDVKVFYETVSEENDDSYVIQYNIDSFKNLTPRGKYYINVIISIWGQDAENIIKLEQITSNVFDAFNFKRKTGDGCIFYTIDINRANAADSNSSVQSSENGQTKRRLVIFEGYVWM